MDIEKLADLHRYFFIAYATIVAGTIVLSVLIFITRNKDEGAVKLGLSNVHRNLFIVNVSFLVMMVVLSVLMFITSNKYQSTVQAHAKVAIESAKTEAADAKSRAEEAALLTLNMQKEVAEAKRKQAEAERSLLQLQQRVGPRHLTDEMKNYLKKALRGMKGDIKIRFISGDIESRNFADEIAEFLSSIGWDIGKVEYITYLGTPKGIFFDLWKEPPHFAIALTQALLKMGFHVGWQNNRPRAEKIQLVVCSKP